jgi:serine kinase of HPr protein (carbohydrate metabolism regulator)
MQAALANPFMTEVWIVKAIMSKNATAALVSEVSHHVKWSLRKEIRIALLKNDMTPLGRVLAFAQSMSAPVLREVLATSLLSAKVKEYLTKELENRKSYQLN